MTGFRKPRAAHLPAASAENSVTGRPTATLPATPFRLIRYFSMASIAAFVLFAAGLLYVEHLKGNLFRHAQEEHGRLFAVLQDGLLRRHDAGASAYVLRLYETSNTNLARLLSNAMWERDFAPLLAKAQSIPADRCRAIASLKNTDGKAGQASEQRSCYARIGERIRALPEFRALDARIHAIVKHSTVLKIKAYDLRGLTVYSSEHRQIGEDDIGNQGWKSAAAGRPASQLTRSNKFSAFEGEVADRHLISSYLPIRAGRPDNIVGVLEIYSDVTPFVDEISGTSLEIRSALTGNRARFGRAAASIRDDLTASGNALLAAIVGTLALLYLVLFLVVRHAQTIIDTRDAERRRAALALARQKDLYDALSQTNKAIVRVTHRDELFESVCRIAVEHGHFLFAWVGLVDEDNPSLKPVARYGEVAGYMNQLKGTGDTEEALRQGLTARTLSSGTHVVSNDFLNDPATAPWQEAGRRAGVRASAKFPIRQGGNVIGAISFYAGETGFFTADLIATLEEMALDVSFALDNFEREAQRKRALEAQRASESRFRSLFENMLNGFAYCRMQYDDRGRPADFVYIEVNRAFERLTGLRHVAGKNVTEAIPGIREANPELFEIYGRVASSGIPATFEIDVKPLQQWFSVSAYSPEKGYFVAVFDVITERKQSEQALRAAEEQFRGLVEQSIAGTYIVQDGRFAYVNPRFAEIFGYDRADQLIGRDPLSVVAPKDRDRIARSLRRRIESEAAGMSDDFQGVRKDGTVFDVGAHGARATHRGQPAVIGLVQDISEKKRAEEQIQRYIAQLRSAFMSTVKVVMTLGEMRDPYTAGHERRVAEIAVAIGAELGFDAARQEGLRVAGYLHDIGKIAIPSEILSKPGRLGPIEFQLIQGHPRAGYDVLKDVEFPWPVAEAAFQHHERLDGSGYPQGLKGEAILLEARILAVADVIEAMASHRPYRAGLGIEKALAEIERGRGSAYDPAVADACLRLFRDKGWAVPK